jgi:hypothetical protein
MYKENVNLLIVLGMIFFLIGNVSAGYAQNTEINFKVSCEHLNCSQTYTVSVEDPQSNLILDGAGTSIQQGYLNFTLNSSQTSQNGIYNVFLIGSGADPFYHSGQIVVTPNGEEPTEANAIFYIGLLVILIFGFGLIVYFGVTSDNLIVKAFSWGFGYLFLIAISFVAWNMAADFLTSSPFLVEFLRILFLVLMIGFFPFILILFAYAWYMALTIKEIKDMVERGIPENEAAERATWGK